MDRDASSPGLACVVLAHGDPEQVHRLVEALDPFPVYLHVDSRTSDDVFRQITSGLPSRCVILPRRPTGWATWGAVEAEIEGYREALSHPGITHVALMTGADYPLASSDEIRAFLGEHRDESFTMFTTLPYVNWGRSGGFDRLRYRHWARGKRMIRLPVPRRLPADVRFAGGSTSKMLTVEHARAVVRTYDSEPDLAAFWRRTWAPDETFIASVVNTPRFVPGWADHHVSTPLWWIDWSGARKKSPPWLDETALPSLLARRLADDQAVPCLFARKFSTEVSGPLMDELDRAFGLRGAVRR
jgi:hypothetical protein